MKSQKRRAILMAAGTSARFVPNCLEYPKGLTVVKGEVLIERQMRQLIEAGVEEIVLVTGYMADQFEYLATKYPIQLIHNPEYNQRNNHSSLYVARDFLEGALICSADNIFPSNPFLSHENDSFYSSVFVEGPTKEWCLHYDEDLTIQGVQVGGCDAWVMLGHAYFSPDFGRAFRDLLLRVYDQPEVRNQYWEDLFVAHLADLPPMKIKQYPSDFIFEFDSLDELRAFDPGFLENPRSERLLTIARDLQCHPSELTSFVPIREGNRAIGFSFLKGNEVHHIRMESETSLID